jgi:hypothetical protein
VPPACVLALVMLTGADRGGAPASVAFDLRGLSAAAYHDVDGLALERKVALRLVQEGFAVVAPGSGADVEVRASVADDGGLVLSAAVRDDDAPPLRSTIAAAEGPTAEWHLEVAHKVSEMARVLAVKRTALTAAMPAPVTAPSSAAAAGAATEATAIAETAARKLSPPADSRWEVGLGAGALWRAGGADPLAGLLATHTRGRLRLHVDLLGARSPGNGIEVWEGQALAGVSGVVIEGPASVDVGLAAGVVAQHFSVASPWATDRAGTYAAPGLWLPLRAGWAAGRLVVAARAALGLARHLDHTSQGATLWSRGSLRLESMLVLAWTF